MISVIIVSWNVRELLKKCLESIFRYTNKNTPMEGVFSGNSAKPVSGISGVSHLEDSIQGEKDLSSATQMDGTGFEVIVIDNASFDGSVEMVRNDFPQTRLIANQENRGFAAASNQGIREAKGEYVLLLNSDTELIENSLQKVVEKMCSDSSISVLGCKLLNPDKTLQPSVRHLPTIWSQLVILFKLHRVGLAKLYWYLMKDFDYEREAEVDQVMGAFFCIRKSLLDKIGLLDEGYFIWFEEVDFCRRTKKAGYKVVYWPGTAIIHHGGQSFAKQMTLKKQWWFFRSALRYFTK